jgi:hypothetical protein
VSAPSGGITPSLGTIGGLGTDDELNRSSEESGLGSSESE